MVGARHLRGTIYTRVANLLRSGAVKHKPVWFDVVEAFPPIVETKINRKPEPGRVTKLEYPEDFFRRKFYNTFKSYEALNLRDGEDPPPTDCEIFVQKCQDFVNQGMDREAAFESASQDFMSETPTFKQLHSEGLDKTSYVGDTKTDISEFLFSKQKQNKLDE